ncbi:hypothetical protein ACWFR1_03285 [Streptomyces sp. NPDC055103]
MHLPGSAGRSGSGAGAGSKAGADVGAGARADVPTGAATSAASDRPARFRSPQQELFPHGQRRTADSLVATLATRAGMLVMPAPEREAALGRIRAFLAGTPETADGEFILPMLTAVLRVRRL